MPAEGNMMNGGGVLFTINADGSPMFKSLEKVDLALLQTERKSKTTAEKIAAAFKSIGGVFDGLSRNYMNIRFAVTDTVAGMKAFTDKALSMRAAMMGLQVIAGKEFGAVKESVKRLALDGQVSITALSTAMKNLLSRGFSAKQAEEMLKVTKAMAMFNRQAGLSMDEAVQRFTEGLRNEMSTLTDSAGATKNLSAVWADYARTIGVGVNSLSTAQKIQAEYNWTIGEGARFQDKYNESLDREEGQIGKANAQFAVLQSTLGEKLLPIQVGLLKTTSGILDFFLRLPGPVQLISVLLPAVAVGLGMIIPGVTALIPIIGSLIAGTATLGVTVGLATGGLSLLAAIVVPLGLGFLSASRNAAEADKRIKDFNERLRNTKDAESYRKALEAIRDEYKKLDDSAKSSLKARLEVEKANIVTQIAMMTKSGAAQMVKDSAAANAGKARGYDNKTKPAYDGKFQPGDLDRMINEAAALQHTGKVEGFLAYNPEQLQKLRSDLALIEAQLNAIGVTGVKAFEPANNGAKTGAQTAKDLRKELLELDRTYRDLYSAALIAINGPMKSLSGEIGAELLNRFSGLSGTVTGLIRDFGKWSDASRKLASDQEKLAVAAAHLLETKHALAAKPDNEGLKAAFEDAKKSVETYTKSVEASKSAVNDGTTAMASAWIAVAQAASDAVYAFIQAFDAVIQNGGSAAEAAEAAFKKSFQAIAEEVPIVGKLIALFIDKIWQTETERRERALNEINAAIERFEHEIRVGSHLFIQQQIDFYERQLESLKAAHAKDEDVWAVEEKLYALKLKQLDAQKELNRQIDEQKRKLEDMQKSETEKQLDIQAREFEMLVKSGEINLGVTEDRQKAIQFYSALAGQADSLVLPDAALGYREKVAELQGGQKETRTYGGVSYSSETADKVAALLTGIGNIDHSVDEALSNDPEYQSEQLRQLNLELFNKTTADAVNLRNSEYDAFIAELRSITEGINTAQDEIRVLPQVESFIDYWIPEDKRAGLIDTFTYSDGSTQRVPNSAKLRTLTYDDTYGGWMLEELRKELIANGFTRDQITFHDGGVVGSSSSFADLFGGSLRPDELIAKLQVGEMVIPRRETSAILSGKTSGSLSIHIGQMVFQQANDPERNARETLKAIEKIANRNGYTVMGGI